MLHLRVHHIGYLVKNIKKAQKNFALLGYETEQDTVYDSIRQINICFLVKDNYRVELVSPVSDTSVVAGLLKRYKNAPYHICYETSDFDADYAYLTANGFIAIDEPTLAPALPSHDVVFLNNAAIGLIELIK